MKERWPGINVADADVASEDALDAEGVKFQVERQLGRRSGLTKYAPAGGISATFLRGSAGGDFLMLCKANGDLCAINLLTPGTVTTLYSSSYNVGVTPTMAAINGRAYITNGWDRPLVWNGVDSTFREAGIVAPAAAPGSPTATSGNATPGVHLIRYRYLDNTSPASSYRSNASPALEYTVATASSGNLVFDIATAAADIIRSDDAKVTTIQLEATLQSGTTYFVVGTVNNAATAITYNIADAVLALQDRARTFDSGNALDTDDFGTGNERPPLGTIIAQVRDITFIGGDSPRTITATFTNNSTAVTGTGFSPNWGNQFVIRGGSDAKVYQIASSTSTTITLVNAYTGVTGSKAAIVSAQNPNRIYWSAFISEVGAAMPESWRLLARARDVLGATGDTLRGITELNGDALIAGAFSLQRLIFVDDITLGELDVVSGQFGVYNQRCFVSVEGQVFGLGPNGAWTCRGGAPEWLSRPIDSLFHDMVDEPQASEFHGVYDPPTKTVRWFYTPTDETRPVQTIAIDLAGRRWTREGFLAGMDASLYGADSSGHLRSFLMDATGGFTFTNEGSTDGVPTGTGAYTANTGSTTTITQVTDSLPTGTSLTDLSGLMLYRPDTDETVRITSNTSSAITHAAFATSVVVGEALYVGSIPWSWSTGWWIGKGMEYAKRGCLFIECQPGAVSGTGTVQIYKNWETSPIVWTREATYDPPKGVTFTDGDNFMTVEFGLATTTDGLLKLPMSLDNVRSLRATMTILSPSGTLKLLDIYFAIQDGDDSKVKTVQQ